MSAWEGSAWQEAMEDKREREARENERARASGHVRAVHAHTDPLAELRVQVSGELTEDEKTLVVRHRLAEEKSRLLARIAEIDKLLVVKR